MPWVRTAAALVAFLSATGWAWRARAINQDEWQVALRTGAAVVHVDGRSPWGPAGALDLAYGILDAWALRLSFEGSYYSVDKQTKPALPAGTINVESALAGITYTVDILRLVPYGDLEIGVARFGGAVTAPLTSLAAELGFGADYYLTQHWLAGASIQYLYSPSNLLSNPQGLGNSPFMFSVTARLAYGF
jgi:hypothetical protein